MAELAALSVALAKSAIRENEGQEGRSCEVWIAASIPPLGESYHDSGRLLGAAEAKRQYAELLQGLQDADIFLCETMASLNDASLAAEAVRQRFGSSARLWISFTPRIEEDAKKARLRGDSATVSEAVSLAAEFGAEAVLFNCATPETISLCISEGARCMALSTNATVKSMRLGGYGNFWDEASQTDTSDWSITLNEKTAGGDDRHAKGMVVRKDLSEASYSQAARGWLDDGATVVGGCCGIGPQHINSLGRSCHVGTNWIRASAL